MKNVQPIGTYLALVMAASTSSGCSSSPSSEGESSTTMRRAMGALEDAVDRCAKVRSECEASSTDPGSAQACQESFLACKDDALGAAMPVLAQGVGVCTDESRLCRKSAETSDAKRSCGEALRACIAADKDTPGAAAAATEHASPIAECTALLRTCIEGDDEPKACTDQLRTCLAAALPNHANGRQGRSDAGPGDRGMSDGHTPEDAGTSRMPIDPGAQSLDAGKSASNR